VIGVGGCGNNALNTMLKSGLGDVEFIAANTDHQALGTSLAEKKLMLGPGLGAGKKADEGRKFAEESSPEIEKALKGADMVFITAGMGGGTGTGAGPVVARIAREMGALTVAVVTLPFDFEGPHRRDIARNGLAQLKEEAHSMIVIPNQRLLSVANRNTTLLEGFKMADQILLHAVKGVVDLIQQTGLVNVDFADVRTIMTEKGMALMGLGEAEGEDRVTEAAHRAISNPLLEDIKIEGARGVLINITGGPDLTLFEITEASELIRSEAHENAMIIFGAVLEEGMENKARVTVIATGFADLTAHRELRKMARDGKGNYLDIPTIIRKRQEERKTEKKFPPAVDEQNEADYDVPTFMRKRAD
jgi:cell division protein FtsZ